MALILALFLYWNCFYYFVPAKHVCSSHWFFYILLVSLCATSPLMWDCPFTLLLSYLLPCWTLPSICALFLCVSFFSIYCGHFSHPFVSCACACKLMPRLPSYVHELVSSPCVLLFAFPFSTSWVLYTPSVFTFSFFCSWLVMLPVIFCFVSFSHVSFQHAKLLRFCKPVLLLPVLSV